MSFKKIIGQIHLWLGLASGLVVLILGITGCFYAFIDEITPMVYQDRLKVEVPVNVKRLPLELLKVNAQQTISKKCPLTDAEFSTLPGHTVSFRARKINEKAILYSNYFEYYYTVYINPYNGKVVEVEDSKWEFFNLVVMMHTSLLLGEWGRTAVEYSVLMFVVLLISGIILWWPKNKKAAKQRFWFRWKDTTRSKRKNYDLHHILGFYAFFIALVIALTGLVWSFEWVSNSVQWIANGGKATVVPKELFSDTTRKQRASLDKILQDAVIRTPVADNFFISFPVSQKSTVFVYARIEGKPNYQSSSSQYDQHTGQLLDSQTFSKMKSGDKIMAMNYDLHTGSVLGLAGKILAFGGSLIVASLPVTGFVIWLNRKKKQKNKSDHRVKYRLLKLEMIALITTSGLLTIQFLL